MAPVPVEGYGLIADKSCVLRRRNRDTAQVRLEQDISGSCMGTLMRDIVQLLIDRASTDNIMVEISTPAKRVEGPQPGHIWLTGII